MKQGFYWYVETGRDTTIVRVSDEGIEFLGNDELYHVADRVKGNAYSLYGKFYGPIEVPELEGASCAFDSVAALVAAHGNKQPGRGRGGS